MRIPLNYIILKLIEVQYIILHQSSLINYNIVQNLILLFLKTI